MAKPAPGPKGYPLVGVVPFMKIHTAMTIRPKNGLMVRVSPAAY